MNSIEINNVPNQGTSVSLLVTSSRPTCRTRRFCLCPAYLALIIGALILAQPLSADSPTTQPTSEETPQAFLAETTNDRVATMSLEHVVSLFDFNPDSAKDKLSATLLAVGVVDQAELELAVRKKWGRAAETAVAHASLDNLPDDVANAKWTIKNGRAKATFQLEKTRARDACVEGRPLEI